MVQEWVLGLSVLAGLTLCIAGICILHHFQQVIRRRNAGIMAPAISREVTKNVRIKVASSETRKPLTMNCFAEPRNTSLPDVNSLRSWGGFHVPAPKIVKTSATIASSDSLSSPFVLEERTSGDLQDRSSMATAATLRANSWELLALGQDKVTLTPKRPVAALVKTRLTKNISSSIDNRTSVGTGIAQTADQRMAYDGSRHYSKLSIVKEQSSSSTPADSGPNKALPKIVLTQAQSYPAESTYRQPRGRNDSISSSLYDYV